VLPPPLRPGRITPLYPPTISIPRTTTWGHRRFFRPSPPQAPPPGAPPRTNPWIDLFHPPAKAKPFPCRSGGAPCLWAQQAPPRGVFCPGRIPPRSQSRPPACLTPSPPPPLPPLECHQSPSDRWLGPDFSPSKLEILPAPPPPPLCVAPGANPPFNPCPPPLFSQILCLGLPPPTERPRFPPPLPPPRRAMQIARKGSPLAPARPSTANLCPAGRQPHNSPPCRRNGGPRAPRSAAPLGAGRRPVFSAFFFPFFFPDFLLFYLLCCSPPCSLRDLSYPTSPAWVVFGLNLRAPRCPALANQIWVPSFFVSVLLSGPNKWARSPGSARNEVPAPQRPPLAPRVKTKTPSPASSVPPRA